MTEQPAEQERLRQFVDYFLDPAHNEAGRHPKGLTLLRPAALGDGPAPIVLPRLTVDERFRLYVIARRPEKTAQARDLLAAFIGPSFAARGDTAPARLDERDQVDRQVREAFGPNSTFIVSVDTMSARRPLREAAERMVTVVNAAPHRDWTATRPLSRQLADFETALLGGSPQAAAATLDRIAHKGGLSPANLISLQVKLLAVCGQDAELLALPGLDRALLLVPPREVKEYVLAAVYGAAVGPALEDGLAAATQKLADPRVPRNLPTTGEDPLRYGDAAVAVLLVALYGQGEREGLVDAIHVLDAAGREGAVPEAIRAVTTGPEAQPADGEESPAGPARLNKATEAPAPEPIEEPAPAVPLESWADLIDAVATGDHVAFLRARAIDAGTEDCWPVSPTDDPRIAQRLSTCKDDEYERLWCAALGPFLKALLDSRESMPKTLEQIVASSAERRRDAAGLAVLGLLLTLSLRSAPGASEYRELLEHVSLMADQWVSAETAQQALDYVDLLAAYAAPDEGARINCALELLLPLVGRAMRLGPVLLDVARALSDELGLGDLGWPAPDKQPTRTATLTPAKILVYGLDEKVLARVKEMTETRHPHVKVTTASDKAASNSLRQKVRNSDRVVMITQCAKHAATICIGQHVKDSSVIVYPEGSGSASVYHALVRALTPDSPVDDDAEA